MLQQSATLQIAETYPGPSAHSGAGRKMQYAVYTRCAIRACLSRISIAYYWRKIWRRMADALLACKVHHDRPERTWDAWSGLQGDSHYLPSTWECAQSIRTQVFAKRTIDVGLLGLGLLECLVPRNSFYPFRSS
jgi:hypothetical protein